MAEISTQDGSSDMKQDRTIMKKLGLACAAASIAGSMAACSGSTDSEQGDGSIDGTLAAVMVGNADRTAAHMEFFIESEAGVWVRLLFDRRPDLVHSEEGHEHILVPGRGQMLAAGAKISVTGELDADGIHVESFDVAGGETDGLGTSSEALIAPNARKVAIILANFTNNTSQPITPTAAVELVFAGAQSPNAYYKEESFGIRSLIGKLAPAGDVFGWYTISPGTTACNYSGWGNSARAAAQSAGVDLSGYDHIIHYFPRTSACAWSGVGQVPGKYTWINGSSAATISHELGHNFGSHHASTLICTSNGARVTVGPTCTVNEYGHPFDVMGSGYRHMTVFNKGRIGFLEPENTVNVVADGTFAIAPLATKSTQVQSLRIPINGTTAYYVEFRQPFGFDNFSSTSSVVNGVLITRAPLSYSTLERPALLDMVPSTSTFTDASLRVGATFTDPASGLSVRLNSISSTAANVTVDMP
jgi:hypothetical protein